LKLVDIAEFAALGFQHKPSEEWMYQWVVRRSIFVDYSGINGSSDEVVGSSDGVDVTVFCATGLVL
jgi:hypothetical protein